MSAPSFSESSPGAPEETKPPRGPIVAGSGRTLGIVVLGVVAVGLVLGIVVALISAGNDNSRTSRLKNQGIHVPVTVTYCLGDLSGSGSTLASYTCHGTYVVHGTTYHEVIGSKSTFSKPGTVIAGVADPTQPSTVVTASSAQSTSTSAAPYVIVAVLVLVLIGTLAWMVILIRRRRTTA